MTGAYAYSPGICPPLVATAFLAAIGLYAWRRRDAPGCFVLDYAFPGRRLTRRNMILPSTPVLLCPPMVVKDDSQLIWRILGVAAGGPVTLSCAAGDTLVVAYGIGMFLPYAVVFVRLFMRSPQHRWPVALMPLGMAGARAVLLLDIADPPSLAPLDLPVFVVVLPWTTYVLAMFGFRILDPLPATRRTGIEQMQAGVVVSNAGWQVVSLNPAAERILVRAPGR